jgi:glycosyltransferase involved in cell wall biosynthesis
MSERNWPSVALCIPTFRRPQGLRKLLTHVGQLAYGGRLLVIVVDNDAGEEAGAHVAERMSQDYPFPLAVVVEPRRGQSYAYNRGFRCACRAMPAPDYVAVLDDDEYPDRAWLTEMVAAALALHADIVGGPVLPVFDDPHHWLARSGHRQPQSCGARRRTHRRGIRHRLRRVPLISEPGESSFGARRRLRKDTLVKNAIVIAAALAN